MYGAIASAAVVVPEGEALDEVHKTTPEMAIAGRVTDAQRRVFFAEGERLCRDRGAEIVSSAARICSSRSKGTIADSRA